MAIIYKHTSPSGKAYIGMTNQTIEERLKGHITESNKDKEKHYKFHYAIKKYGIENFKSEVLEECSNEIADEREKYWISYYDTFNNGYNMTDGGYGRPFGWCHTEETKQKLAISKLGSIPWNKNKTGLQQAWNKGIKLTNEQKKNMGHPHTEETKQKLAEYRTGTTHIEETKLKISIASSGENNGMYGKNHTEETKQKLSEIKIGTKWISNVELKKLKMVKEDELEKYLLNGWVLGMKRFEKD